MTENKWIPCDEALPKGNSGELIPCLVTCRDWDVFKGCYGNKYAQVIDFNIKHGVWNTKSMIKIEAWMLIPKLYEK